MGKQFTNIYPDRKAFIEGQKTFVVASALQKEGTNDRRLVRRKLPQSEAYNGFGGRQHLARC
jgi:ABC-type branched-subunit amino acid transport system substrate-binding protein